MQNRLLIYKMIMRPILLYAAPVWSNTCKSNYKKLKVVQSKTLRMFSREEYHVTNKKIRDILKMSSLTEVIHERSKNFYEEQLPKIESLRAITSLNHQTAPFRIKYKLPHHIHMLERDEQTKP